MQLSDSKSVHPSARKCKWNNTMGNDCLEHDVNSPSSTKNINKTGGLQDYLKVSCFLLSFVDCVEHEFPEKEKAIYERAVTWWHICCSRQRFKAGYCKGVWKPVCVSKTASKQVVKKTGVQKPAKTTRTKRAWHGLRFLWRRGHWRHVSGSRFPLYSCSSSFLCLGEPI